MFKNSVFAASLVFGLSLFAIPEGVAASDMPPEEGIVLSPGESEEVNLQWPDGESVLVTLRVVGGLPSYVPGSIDPGNGGSYEVSAWGGSSRTITFSHPDHADDIVVSWSVEEQGALPPVGNGNDRSGSVDEPLLVIDSEMEIHDSLAFRRRQVSRAGGSYEISPWGDAFRTITFSHPDHEDDIVVSWSVLGSDPPSWSVPSVPSVPEKKSIDFVLSPGDWEEVDLQWPDGESVSATLRVYDGLPSYIPDSIDPGAGGSYEISAWGSRFRTITFSHPDHEDDIVVSWSVLGSATPSWSAPSAPSAPEKKSTDFAGFILSPGESREVNLQWPDGESVSVTLRVVDGLPSYVPGSIDAGSASVVYSVDQVEPECSGMTCDVTDSLGSHQDWGKWNTYSGFFVGPHDINHETIVLSTAIGEESGSAPNVIGTATWEGSLVGADVTPARFGNRISGDVSLTVRDLSLHNHPGTGKPLSLTFTSVRDEMSGKNYAIIWGDMDIEDDGSFSIDGLKGRFYGPNHEEAAGTFEWAAENRLDAHIIGAFGVKEER